jgi:predicted nucleic acid-binding protein
VAVYHADSSALVKLVREEPESPALRAFIAAGDLASCELVLAEVPRAIRRASAQDPRLDLEVLMARAGEVIDAVALVPLDRPLLLAAGALAEPSVRALDAIHIAAAASLTPIDGFLGYDERQAAAARLAGLRTFAPGA